MQNTSNNDQIQAEDSSNKRPLIGVIYETYAKRCFKAGAMDFDDLVVQNQCAFKEPS